MGYVNVANCTVSIYLAAVISWAHNVMPHHGQHISIELLCSLPHYYGVEVWLSMCKGMCEDLVQAKVW